MYHGFHQHSSRHCPLFFSSVYLFEIIAFYYFCFNILYEDSDKSPHISFLSLIVKKQRDFLIFYSKWSRRRKRENTIIIVNFCFFLGCTNHFRLCACEIVLPSFNDIPYCFKQKQLSMHWLKDVIDFVKNPKSGFE